MAKDHTRRRRCKVRINVDRTVAALVVIGVLVLGWDRPKVQGSNVQAVVLN
jgi:hypothetical protein